MRRRAVPFVILGLTLIASVVLLERGKLSRAQSDTQPLSTDQPAAVSATDTVSTYTAFCGLWRVDEGFVSTIHVKNSLIIGPLEVTPVLYMADGTEYALAPVTIATAGVASVNVNQALSEAPPEMASHLSSFGSAALRYQNAWPAALAADMSILNVADSLIFTSAFNEYGEQAPAAQTLEGLWWKHDPDVGGFVSLANTTGGDLSLAFEIIGSAGSALPAQSLTIPGHATRRLDLDDLIAGLPGLETQQGGVRIQYNGGAGDLMVVGGLENRRAGYSADMPFAARDLSSTDAAAMTYANLGLRVGEPDPAAGFPGGTKFVPYAALRNTTEKPLTVSSTLNTMAGGKPVSMALPNQQLKPFESRQLDFQALLQSAGLEGFRGDVNVALSFKGHAGDLVFATGSVDQTGTYVFGVLPSGVGKSRSKESPFWTVANGFDTRLALWNTSTDGQAQDLLVTLYYGDGSGKYKLPVHLDGQASVLIDLAQLIAAQRPDAEGHTIPATVQSGSVVVSSAKGEAQSMTVALSDAIFNVSTATCVTFCTVCNGISTITVTINPFACPVGFTVQLKATGNWNTGLKTDETANATWSSSSTAIATVSNTSGSKGKVTGVAPGSCTIKAFENVDTPASFCGGFNIECPTGNLFGTSPGSVTPTVTLSCSPLHLALGKTSGAAPPSTTGGTCTATVKPTGGNFFWSVNTTSVTPTPNFNTLLYDAQAKSASQGDTIITVDYTVNTKSGSAKSPAITVHQPTSLFVQSDTTNPTGKTCTVTCLDGTPGCTYTSYLRTRIYVVKDQFGTLFPNVGINQVSATEDVPIATTCPNLTISTGTSSNSTFTDSFMLCHTFCLPGGPGCTAQTNPVQTINVNGFPVRTETINFTCSSVTLNP